MFELLAEYGTDALAILMAVMALIKIVVRLTPSLKDDAVFAKLDSLFEAIIPNYTKDADTPK
tara:strand:+ start:11836 stop:12021 length:186 start_codon:yes stop_codon:yes gene_type:complete